MNILAFTAIAVAYGRRGRKAEHWPLKFTSNSEHLCFLGILNAFHHVQGNLCYSHMT